MCLKQMYKTLILPLLLTAILIFSSCNTKPGSLGYQNRLFVVADSSLWREAGDDLSAVFETEIVTPHTEKNFFVTQIPLDKLNAYKDRMNIVFMGLSSGTSDVDNYLKKYLPEEFRVGVDSDQYFYVFNDDMFARDQVGLIMYAKDVDAFRERLASFKLDIYNRFEEKYFTRLEKTMFERDEQRDLRKFLEKNYGWSVRLQQDYFLALQDIDNKFVWLRRINPNRWISIWETEGDSSKLTIESIAAERNRMARAYYQGDVIEEEDLYLSDVDFIGQRAKKLTGLWRNDSLLVGGPFRLYSWYDQENNKIRYIDIAVMAPGKLKKPFLDQLEVIAHTFKLAGKDE